MISGVPRSSLGGTQVIDPITALFILDMTLLELCQYEFIAS